MATLTRKSKALEVIPKYEMVTHYRGCTIPTSHLKLYDPDNITIACSMFRVSTENLIITILKHHRFVY